FGFEMHGQFAEAVGRDANLSDRTRIWEVLLRVPINPLVGTGYQSFWLGPRVQWVWARLSGDNVLEAHNGYLAIYLELGLTGLLLLVPVVMGSSRTICKRSPQATALRSLGLALWPLLLFYNVTEAAFGGGLLWVPLLMGTLPVPPQGSSASPAAAGPAGEG